MIEDKLIIRKEEPSDIPQTDAMVRRAFYNKFNPGADEPLLMQKLRAHADYLPELSRVAVLDGRVVGGIFYSKAWIETDKGRTDIVTFGPLCVDHALKNHGIGGRLLRETLPLVKAAGYPGVALVGEKDYYPKFGFRQGGTFGLVCPYGRDNPHFLALELKENGLHIPDGMFVESPCFAALPRDEADALDARFPFIAKVRRPCQWSYDNAEDEKNGYHLEYAILFPRVFEALWTEYIDYLSVFDAELKAHEKEMLAHIRKRVSAAGYVIFAREEPIGLMVCSGPEKPDEGYAIYLEEIYLKPAYRNRGIGKDILLRMQRQQEGDMGFCAYKNNENAVAVWEHILNTAGLQYDRCDERGKWWFYAVRKR